MHTVLSLAERLDMTAEEAVEKLRFMLFDVDGVESVITDEQCDLLIDVDDDDAVAVRIREEKLKEQEKEQKRKERLKKASKKAAASRKKKSDAKSKAKKKPAAKKADVPEAPEEEPAAEMPTDAPAAEVELVEETPSTAEILPAAEAAPEPVEEAPAAEVIEEAVEPAEPAVEAEPVEEAAPAEQPEQQPEAEEMPAAEVLPAEEQAPAEEEEASTPAEPVEEPPEVEQPPAAEIVEEEPAPAQPAEIEEPVKAEIVEEEPVAQAEPAPPEAPEKPEEEKRGEVAKPERPPEPTRSQIVPDPAVVEAVRRKAAERMQEKMRAERGGGRAAPAAPKGRGAKPEAPSKPGRPEKPAAEAPPAAAPEKEGKRGKKKGKRGRQQSEEELRREAAAAVREFDSSPGGHKRRKRRRGGHEESFDEEASGLPSVVEVDESITVEELAEVTDLAVNDLILELMDHDIMATKNEALDIGVVRALLEPKGIEVRSAIPEEEELLAGEPDPPESLKPRAPVITVMGHVDHGKTTLLDRVREANVAEGEAGGITQHIAAYEAQVGEGRVVFLDTPGHEAFTQMRARGAQATDVVVLVVAADDGVMPQTREAIDHARAAGVPIVVAVNKCDKPDAQPDRIRQELTKFELVSEDWGGDTIIRDISAKSGEGVAELMEMLALQAELLELKANPDKKARGVIVESEISRGQGPVAWVLVQEGTLHVGDTYLAGTAYGRVRSMINARGENVEEAGPAVPVIVTGFSEPPSAGDQFVAVQDERAARALAAKRSDYLRQKEDRKMRRVSLEDFHERLLAGEKQTLHMVIKADVQGSVDVLSSSMGRLGNEEVGVQVVHSGVGGINESDVLLASASDAVIIGFHVTANPRVQRVAEQEGVDIRTYQIIYEALEDVRKALEGMLAPDTKEVVTGHAEIRAVFRSSAIGNIAGCYVTDGEVARNSKVRVVRDDVVMKESTVATLRRGKDDVRDVQTGFECGIKVDGFDDIQEGDVLEFFRLESVAKSLA